MDRNKKQNSVRYNCQVRDINKKSVSNTASTLTFVLSRKLLERSLLAQLPFYATFAPTLPLLYASAKAQMQVKRVLD